jgi:7,8-dihydropterin-6-yl-methyl-4-(beta-D-ribofuranosyl)aminobenzene 5'-phosphate synthase
MKTRIPTTVCSVLLASLLLVGAIETSSCESEENINITILYDNYVFTEGLKSDWGFSCFLKGTEKTILFDTGTKGDLLLENIEKLKLNPKDVDLVVISHNHEDHTGGLLAFLGKNSDVSVYLPPSCSESFILQVKEMGAKVLIPNDPVEICQGVYLTGPLGDEIIEQSMILDTAEGAVLITGCSHPGIINIIRKSKEILPKDTHLVFGGFHLVRTSETRVRQIIGEFEKLGVKKAGPTHCTGDQAIRMFRNAYGADFVQMGVGRTLQIKALSD